MGRGGKGRIKGEQQRTFFGDIGKKICRGGDVISKHGLWKN